jgi:hypothetical protein
MGEVPLYRANTIHFMSTLLAEHPSRYSVLFPKPSTLSLQQIPEGAVVCPGRTLSPPVLGFRDQCLGLRV